MQNTVGPNAPGLDCILRTYLGSAVHVQDFLDHVFHAQNEFVEAISRLQHGACDDVHVFRSARKLVRLAALCEFIFEAIQSALGGVGLTGGLHSVEETLEAVQAVRDACAASEAAARDFVERVSETRVLLEQTIPVLLARRAALQRSHDLASEIAHAFARGGETEVHVLVSPLCSHSDQKLDEVATELFEAVERIRILAMPRVPWGLPILGGPSVAEHEIAAAEVGISSTSTSERPPSQPESIPARGRALSECGICMDKPVQLVFDCGHAACSVCGSRISSCHVCRASVTRRTQIFL